MPQVLIIFLFAVNVIFGEATLEYTFICKLAHPEAMTILGWRLVWLFNTIVQLLISLRTRYDALILQKYWLATIANFNLIGHLGFKSNMFIFNECHVISMYSDFIMVLICSELWFDSMVEAAAVNIDMVSIQWSVLASVVSVIFIEVHNGLLSSLVSDGIESCSEVIVSFVIRSRLLYLWKERLVMLNRNLVKGIFLAVLMFQPMIKSKAFWVVMIFF